MKSACRIALNAVGALTFAGCAAARTPSSHLVSASGAASVGDTALYAAVLRSLDPQPIYELEVDTRPLKADPNLVYVHAGDYASVPRAVVARRNSVARRLGGRVSDYSAEHCESGPGGLRIITDTTDLNGPAGPRPFCVIAAVPRPGGAYFPPGGIDRRANVPAGSVTTRVVVSTASAPLRVYDVVAEPVPSGGWRVVESVLLWWVYS